MSQCSNGMIAHVAKPGTLDDALNKVMLQNDPASPFPEMPAEDLVPAVETPR